MSIFNLIFITTQTSQNYHLPNHWLPPSYSNNFSPPWLFFPKRKKTPFKQKANKQRIKKNKQNSIFLLAKTSSSICFISNRLISFYISFLSIFPTSIFFSPNSSRQKKPKICNIFTFFFFAVNFLFSSVLFPSHNFSHTAKKHFSLLFPSHIF